MQSMLEMNIPWIVPTQAQQLNSKMKRILSAYTKQLEASFKSHGLYLYEYLWSLETKVDYPASAEISATFEKIDKLIVSLTVLGYWLIYKPSFLAPPLP